MGTQLSLLQDFYKDDERKMQIFKALTRISSDIKFLYGKLLAYEGSQGMFSDKGRQANACIDELENVSTALGMVMYDEVSDIPEVTAGSAKEAVDGFCKLELIGMKPAPDTTESILNFAYSLPTKVYKISEEIDTHRKDLLHAALLKFITELEDLDGN